MILYDLSCRNGHVFEAWFRDGAAFETQRKGRKIACPDCGDHRVKKAPTATKAVAPPPDVPPEMLQAMRKLRQHVESHCDYVGPRFAEEARAIHYGERDQRGIYGEASDEEAKELAEEGIEVARIPWLPRQDA